jgi:hypothetical protein
LSRARTTPSVAEGYVDAKVGSGTYVAQDLPEELLRARTTGPRDDGRGNMAR